jgi:hypothetical protein
MEISGIIGNNGETSETVFPPRERDRANKIRGFVIAGGRELVIFPSG